jgi:hypothetical protein
VKKSLAGLLGITLSLTLLVATVGIVGLMWHGVNVAREVSLAVAAQWGAMLVVFREMVKEQER